MSKYERKIRNETVDVYDVLVAFNVSNPGLQHAIKKLLMPGQRGIKTITDDLNEAIAAISRAIDIEAEKAAAIAVPPAPPFAGAQQPPIVMKDD